MGIPPEAIHKWLYSFLALTAREMYSVIIITTLSNYTKKMTGMECLRCDLYSNYWRYNT
jgi:hypothetical protein